MSKPVKEMIIREYRERFSDLTGTLVVDIRGIEANKNNELRNALREKDVRITVVKNALVKHAIQDTPLEAVGPALEGPAAFAYGADSVVAVARELVEWAKKIKKLDLKGAVLDGTYFDGAEGVKRLSEFPTKEEAQAKVIQLVLSPASRLMGAAKSPGSKIMGIVKEIQERLEKGEVVEARS